MNGRQEQINLKLAHAARVIIGLRKIKMRKPLDTFYNMKHRCYNPKDKRYGSYGGKGIVICNSWLKTPVSFATWSEKNNWESGKHIHRKNKIQGYSPGNCEWLSPNKHRKAHGLNINSSVFCSFFTVYEFVKNFCRNEIKFVLLYG